MNLGNLIKKYYVSVILFVLLLIGSFYASYSYNMKKVVITDDIKSRVESSRLDYVASSTDRDNVHNYAVGLIIDQQYGKAYQVVSKYFNDVEKTTYWDDVDLWLDKGVASNGIHKCLEAGTSAWHVLMRTQEGEDTNNIAQTLMSSALNSKDCVDTDDTKKVNNELMADAVKNSESKIMK